MLRDARGHYVVAQTTFDDTGAVDLDSLDLHIDFYLRHGAASFTVLGVSGEAGKLRRQRRSSSPRARRAR